MASDLQRFKVEGSSDLANAKIFNNVIASPFFDIPLDQVQLMKQLLTSVHVILVVYACVKIFYSGFLSQLV